MKLCDVILGPKRSFLTTAWRLLLSRMQWAAGAERRWLRIYWDRTDGTSTLGLMAVGPYRKSYTEYTKIGQMAHPPWDWRQLVHIGRVTQNTGLLGTQSWSCGLHKRLGILHLAEILKVAGLTFMVCVDITRMSVSQTIGSVDGRKSTRLITWKELCGKRP